MREASIYSVGVPPEFGLLPGDVLYHTERLSHELSCLLYNMSQAGFVLRQTESADFSGLQEQVTTLQSSVTGWLAGDSSLPAVPLPDIASIVALVLAGDAGGVVALLVEAFAPQILEWLVKRTVGSPSGGGVDLTELVDVLKTGLTASGQSVQNHSIFTLAKAGMFGTELTFPSVLLDAFLMAFRVAFWKTYNDGDGNAESVFVTQATDEDKTAVGLAELLSSVDGAGLSGLGALAAKLLNGGKIEVYLDNNKALRLSVSADSVNEAV